MSGHHIVTAYCPFGLGDIAMTVRFNYTPGRPAVMYLRNGDPGHPADPAEVEFVSARLGISDEWLNKMASEWAEEWLASDEGYVKACEAAESRIEADRERAAEMRAELQKEDRQ